MKLFRIFKSEGEPLAVAMAGIKLGDRLLMLGCGDPRLIAQLAVKTGLTGRAFAADARADLTAAAEQLAPREGALIGTATVQWSALPLEPATFDVAVVRHVFPGLSKPDRIACATEIPRVLRPGGRCLAIDPGQVAGLAGLVNRTTVTTDYSVDGGAVATFEAAGFRGARVLAERDGMVFSEAARANP